MSRIPYASRIDRAASLPRQRPPDEKHFAAPLLPLIPAGAAITPELDASLTAAAQLAKAGDTAARNALFLTLRPKIERFVFRCYRRSGQHSAAWNADDLAQEAFLVFDRLITAWPGRGSFAPYFLSAFPRRLSDTVRRSGGFRPVCPPPTRLVPTWPTAVAEPSWPLLEELAARLPPAPAELLLLHVRDQLSFTDIARRRGVHPMTVRRHWHRLLPVLRTMLVVSRQSPGSGQ